MAGLAVQVALHVLWSATPGTVGEFTRSPIGVLTWWLSLRLGPAANCAPTGRWVHGGGPLGPVRVGLWTVRACAAGTAMWVVSVVPLFVLAVVLV
ncbi:hypothetical protein [Kitasatospora sp. DSM 101779]|uniref:hypothetical protein n=1 Tax=Kitasatospora sp. DSM 101779 TaxID=2853165 RepID=UPI0021D925A6|nr:hypothetical protein [Kitasatospora sp. DSM 101779]MCU7825785.1 hypothetical protein [Kitasatospora sp. DSM 101779]